MSERSILLLDDMPALAQHFAGQLASLGWQCQAVGSVESALLALDKRDGQAFVACFVELHLSSGNGYSAGRALMDCSGLACVLLAGPVKPTDRMWACRLGFAALIERPCGNDELWPVLRALEAE